jgi:RNA polymerase sigma-B factor
MQMEATIRSSDRTGVARVAITGEIDVESGALVDACVASACRVPAPTVVLDLRRVTRLAPGGVQSLAAAREVVEAAGRRFLLTHVAPGVAGLLAADGLGDCITEDAPYVAAAPAPVPGATAGLHAVPDPHPAVAEPVDTDTLIRTHRHLAERLALRFTGRGQPAEDLTQVAYVGLVTAAQRFDADRGVQFATFAQATIVGELKKYFRDHAWQLHVARPVQELYLAVRAASEDMTHRIGRTPTPAELAEHLGVTEEQVVESLEARSALHVDSLDRPRDDEDGGSGSWHEQPATEDGYRMVEERSWLVPALALLPERERRIIKLRFFDGLPQSAIAAKIGISQMHVSRLLARSLATLRTAATDSSAAAG